MLAEGRAARRDGVVVRAAPSGDAPVRLGVRVSARGPARAVRRNRVRRRIRHAFGDVAPATGWDVAVIVQPEAVDRSFQELGTLLEGALSEALEGAR